ncbi:hypothetical protein BAUCODRAFT_576909 [Baudoinia panamericana UAMH 10762]|uniref:DUF8212 domain-containing protein n=1 Tax=Baudoinia panamericana (strain UAMH 10762) TaxID=717646 RepID=M2N9C4_BAUPA|nr:uncharacterized protein BAUCODRAFT_576909 [Baudoinia panamericana UAMH 10762]EMC95704.1 hypothetical protein BAUCODRAFT_576909 [Baudoinia panamericana UAMH 10762]
MSWAAGRNPTRVEERAYSLLGIFDVHMPLIYGEGEKAFLRFQEEIVKRSDDNSLFAWPIHDSYQPQLLVNSPDAFASCGAVRCMQSRKGRSSYSLTNRGLSIKLPTIMYSTEMYLVRLDRGDPRLLSRADSDQVASFLIDIFLMRLDKDDQFARVEHAG